MFANTPALRRTQGFLVALGACAALSACYVVPMNPDGSPAWQYLPAHAQIAPVSATGTVFVAPAVPAVPSGPMSYQARLYPMNEQAARTGQLVATITDLNTGRGMLTMNLGGEYLSGEATRVSDAHPGFGAVYQKVLNTPIRMQPGQPKGIANATGSRGTWVHCEYVLERGGRGTGACLMSDGAAYQIHFGA